MSEAIESVDTVVVGAGHAGLAMSRCLQRAGISHVVIEREAVGASWKDRWDTFHLNTPSGVNVLPDGKPPGEPSGFVGRDTWLSAMAAYATEHGLPIRTGIEVRAVRRAGSGYEVQTQAGTFASRNVVLCTGDQNVPRVPALAASLPDDVVQLHSAKYRSPSQLPAGAVLVVGSGQSGAQVVEDLLDAGRTVFLCTSAVGWAPRRYRGRDVTAWVRAIGMTEQSPRDVPEPERRAPQPMISGAGGGHSVSLQWLGNRGAKLLGRLAGIEGRTLAIGDDLLANVALGVQAAAKVRTGIDGFIDRSGEQVPPAEVDPADAPCEALESMGTVRRVDLGDENIGSVIWATGFGGDFSYLPADLLDASGLPRHSDGVCADGLYCLGLLWTRRRASGLIPGAAADAEFLLEQIRARN